MNNQNGQPKSLNTAALFAGIAGIEVGLERAGHKTSLLCENNPSAIAVLSSHFPSVSIIKNVKDIDRLPAGIDLLTAGFPCQDLSQAGETRGIRGEQSGLVNHVFRLLEDRPTPWVLLENVPFMLQLRGGMAIRYIADRLETLGYRWAYRVIDTRAFGIPHRRERVFLLASLDTDPAPLLLSDDETPSLPDNHVGRACGFYWTEGNRGLGWAIDAIPTLKGGSTIGIPSPPAIWMPDGRIVTPDIRDAERLQGFPPDWTLAAEEVSKPSYRWKLVGNAVTVDVAAWIGERLRLRKIRSDAIHPSLALALPLPSSGTWPKAAFGSVHGRFGADLSGWPVKSRASSLAEYLKFEPKPLSYKATAGFLNRLLASSLRYPPAFKDALIGHLARMSQNDAISADSEVVEKKKPVIFQTTSN